MKWGTLVHTMRGDRDGSVVRDSRRNRLRPSVSIAVASWAVNHFSVGYETG
jgi:hypothetical protein